MTFVNLKNWFFTVFFLCGVSAFADPASFDVTAPAQPSVGKYNDQQSGLIGDLKFRAVVEFLQGYLGARYRNFEKLVTPDFAEKYILDYKVGRLSTDRSQLEVTGHLDADSLKRWARLTDTKSRGASALRPLFLITSNLPAFTLTTADVGPRLRESVLAQTILTATNSQLAKYNLRFSLATTSRVALGQPAKSESEIRALSAGFNGSGYNTALWFHVSACKTCGGSRLETYFYSLTQSRVLLSRGDDLALDPKDFSISEKIRKVVTNPLKQFQSDFESISSSGELFSNVYHVTIEGIENYRTYKNIETELSRLDALSHSQLVLAEYSKKLADFEVSSQLSAEELKERLKTTEFARANLRINVR